MKTLTPIILIAASLGLFYLFVNPQYKELKVARARAVAYDTAITTAQTVVAKQNELVARKDSFDPTDIDRLNTLLPDKIDNIRLIIYINDIARTRGLTITDIKVAGDSGTKTTNSSDTKLYGNVVTTFSVTSSYDQFQKLMADYEKSLRLLDVSQVSIKPTDDGTPYTFSVSFKTYWLK